MFVSSQAFLSKYVDENAVSRRRSQSEDDNPPSPVTMDSDGTGGNVSFLGHHRSGPQSPAQQREGLRFHPPLTPPSGSNPHTPASPHTANISQVSYPKIIHKSFFLDFCLPKTHFIYYFVTLEFIFLFLVSISGIIIFY